MGEGADIDGGLPFDLAVVDLVHANGTSPHGESRAEASAGVWFRGSMAPTTAGPSGDRGDGDDGHGTDLERFPEHSSCGQNVARTTDGVEDGRGVVGICGHDRCPVDVEPFGTP